MGQYFLVVNVDKGEYLHAHKINRGLKLNEIAFSAGGITTLMVLLMADNDPYGENKLVGAWCGDRVIVAGDYGVPGQFNHLLSKYLESPNEEEKFTAKDMNLYEFAYEFFEDVTVKYASLLK